jgi:hypothetical protein
MKIQIGDFTLTIGFPQTFILLLVLIIGGTYVSGIKLEIGSICFPPDKCMPKTPFGTANDATLVGIAATQTTLSQTIKSPTKTTTPTADFDPTLLPTSTEQQAPLPPQTICTEQLSQGQLPSTGQTYSVEVEPNTFDIWTSGDICVGRTCFSGGTNQGNVIIMLPESNRSITYSLRGLITKNGWHGSYIGCSSADQEGWINQKIYDMQQLPQNCPSISGCQFVEVGIFQGNKLIKRYTSHK